MTDYKQLLLCHVRMHRYRLLQSCCKWKLLRSQGVLFKHGSEVCLPFGNRPNWFVRISDNLNADNLSHRKVYPTTSKAWIGKVVESRKICGVWPDSCREKYLWNDEIWTDRFSWPFLCLPQQISMSCFHYTSLIII